MRNRLGVLLALLLTVLCLACFVSCSNTPDFDEGQDPPTEEQGAPKEPEGGPSDTDKEAESPTDGQQPGDSAPEIQLPWVPF